MSCVFTSAGPLGGSPTGLRRGRRVVLLTVFRKTRGRETSEVERAIAAQQVCEEKHQPATHSYDREGWQP